MQQIVIISGIFLELIVILSLMFSPLHINKVKQYFILFSFVRLVWTSVFIMIIGTTGDLPGDSSATGTYLNPIIFPEIAQYPPIFIGPLYFYYYNSLFGFDKKNFHLDTPRKIVSLTAIQRFLFYNDKKLYQKSTRHFFVSFLLLILAIEVTLASSIDQHYISKPFINSIRIFFLIYTLCYYYFTAYSLYTVNDNKTESIIGIILSAGYSITIISIFIRLIFPGKYITSNFILSLLLYDTVIYSLNIVLLFRYPYLQGLSFIYKKLASLKNKDTVVYNEIKTKFNRLFLIDKIYRVEDLTLNMLALELKVQPYQLSFFLNNYIGKSFYSLVNSYRVEEAKLLLIDHPHKTIITIAFETGFNSKSSFNRVFLKETGMTPSDYREKYMVTITPNL